MQASASWDMQVAAKVTEHARPVRWFELQNSWAEKFITHDKSSLQPMSDRCHTFLTAGVSRVRKDDERTLGSYCVCVKDSFDIANLSRSLCRLRVQFVLSLPPWLLLIHSVYTFNFFYSSEETSIMWPLIQKLSNIISRLATSAWRISYFHSPRD